MFDRELMVGEVPIPGGSFLMPSIKSVPVLLPGHDDAGLCVQGGDAFHFHIGGHVHGCS
jgi:hypothetical protein